MVFLLVWDKDSYTGSLLMWFPCIYVLKPQFVHLYQTSSLLPSLLLMVATGSLRFLYSFLCSGHINLIQLFGFLPFSYSSHELSPLSVWPMSSNIAEFVLGL
jgi:hypothetical protein